MFFSISFLENKGWITDIFIPKRIKSIEAQKKEMSDKLDRIIVETSSEVIDSFLSSIDRGK